MALNCLKQITRIVINPTLVRNLSVKQQNIKTSGIIVIGDEILKGQVTDTNSPIITQYFHKTGVKVKKISVVGDEVDEVCDEVKHFSQQYTYVITSGGIGPTHDDITFEAVAKAFSMPLVLNRHLQKLCENFFNTTDTNYPGMKLALIPESAKLNYAENSKYPNISVNNVYIFPGVPQLFEKSFINLSNQLFESDVRFYTRCVYFNLSEDKISHELNQLVNEFPNVQFGSYPMYFNLSYQVKVTIESTNEDEAHRAFNKLLERFPKEVIVTVS